MTVELRETIVTPAPNGRVSVQLHISDVPKNAENATLTIAILATLPRSETRLLEGYRIAAIEEAHQVLERLQTELYQQVPNDAQKFLNPKE